MDADLFKPADAAALLAIRAAMDRGTLRRDDLVSAFEAGGLIQAARGLPAALGAIRAVVRGVARPSR